MTDTSQAKEKKFRCFKESRELIYVKSRCFLHNWLGMASADFVTDGKNCHLVIVTVIAADGNATKSSILYSFRTFRI